MAGTTQTGLGHLTEEKIPAKTVMGGSIGEGLSSGVAFVLALIGLAGILPETLLPIAVIAMGAAFLFEGASISMRFSNLLTETSRGRLDRAEFGVGVTSEFLGGITGVVLGILSLLRMHLTVLIPIALIVYGATLMLSSGVTFRLNAIEADVSEESTQFKKIAHEAMSVSALTEFVLGIAAAVLGIIAISGIYTSAISFVGMMVIGFSGLIAGAAVTTRMISLFRK